MDGNRTGQPSTASGFAVSLFVVVTVLLAPLGVLGGKGMVAALVVAGLIALIDLVRLQRLSEIFSAHWLVLILVLLVSWAVLGGLVTQGKVNNTTLLLRLTALSVLGLVVHAWVAGLPPVHRRRLEDSLLIGVYIAVLLAALFLIVLNFSGQQLWGSNALDRFASVRPGAAIISVLIWPCAMILWRRGWKIRMWAFVVVALIGIAPGGSAMVSLLAGGVAFMLLFFLGRQGGLVVGVAIMALVMLLPVFFQRGPSPSDIIETVPSLSSSAQHRLYIWEFTSKKIAEKPVTGWGFDSSRSIPAGNDPAPVGASLLPLHPHNAALQVWLELGLPGALLMAALFGYYFIQRSGGADLSPYLAVRGAMLVTLTGNAMLSYGVWQNWWVASMWLLPAVFDAISGHQSSDHTTPSG